MMKEAIGEWCAELLVEEDEKWRDLGRFLCQPIGISLFVSCKQPMCSQLAQFVLELIESIPVRADA